MKKLTNRVVMKRMTNQSEISPQRNIYLVTEQMLELHRGQGKELFWRDTVTCPTEAEYEEMVVQSTWSKHSVMPSLHSIEIHFYFRNWWTVLSRREVDRALQPTEVRFPKSAAANGAIFPDKVISVKWVVPFKVKFA